jgi:polyhydroxyalkanoate synthesis regulator protein
VARFEKTAYFQSGPKKAVDPAGDSSMQFGKSDHPILIKKYPNRRLYRPDLSRYLTREELIAMAQDGEQFVIVDASTGEDVTVSFRPIMVEH